MDDIEQPQSIGEPSPFVDLVVGPGSHDNRRFGEMLQALRKQAGFSRLDAANRLGFSSEYVRLIEAGKRTPALGQMRAILHAYGAEGAVEQVSPQGYRQDLILFEPFRDEPTVVQFKSRIREARRRAAVAGEGEESSLEPARRQSADRSLPTRNIDAELGAVIHLLVQANGATLAQVRRLLEGSVRRDF